MIGKPVIAIASGKGGTGKTTLSVNLAGFLNRNGLSVQYLDCDVEEPNGAIFLKPNFQCRKVVWARVPEVDLSKCSGCGKCGHLCQYGAIVSVNQQVLTFHELCHSCGGCSQVCPSGAITETVLEIGILERGPAERIDCVQGLLEIGSVRAPRVIQEVKSCTNDKSVTILDAPPGTSCSVIASVKEADFALLVAEPTTFGLHDLKLAVGMVRALELPFSVVINRDGIGDNRVERYCMKEGIEIVMRLHNDRRIAQAYSTGRLIVDVLPEYNDCFSTLKDKLHL